MEKMPEPRLFLIDTYGFIFRAYLARARSGAPPMRTSTAISTEAIYIFHNMLRKLKTTFNPEYIAAIFESAGPTFRDKQFAEYKANRSEMPSDLGEQIPYIRRLLEALRVPILQYSGFDDDRREFRSLADRAADLFGMFEAVHGCPVPGTIPTPKQSQTRQV
jgi:DNA polymerase-1